MIESPGSEPPTHAFSVKRAPRLSAALRPLVDDVVTSFSSRSRSRPRRRPRPALRPGGQASRAATHRRLDSGLRQGEGHRGVQLRAGTPCLRCRSTRVGRGSVGGAAGLQEEPSRRDIADNASCFGYGRLRSNTILTDGQMFPISPGNSFEPQLDTAMVRGMAPRAAIHVHQADSNGDQWFLGASQVLDSPTAPRQLLDLLRDLRERSDQRAARSAVQPRRGGPARLDAGAPRARRRRQLRLGGRRRLELQRRPEHPRKALPRRHLAGFLAVLTPSAETRLTLTRPTGAATRSRGTTCPGAAVRTGPAPAAVAYRCSSRGRRTSRGWALAVAAGRSPTSPPRRRTSRGGRSSTAEAGWWTAGRARRRRW